VHARTLVLTHHRPRSDERVLKVLAEEVVRDFSDASSSARI
jgi:hypothetical protein